jgi:predicted transcriptional regulator
VKPITIRLPNELHARLKLEAGHRGITMTAIAREAIDRCVPHGRLSFVASGEGLPRDATVRIDEHVPDQAPDRTDEASSPRRS